MTDKLPPNLLALFAARPALRYLPPSDHDPSDRKTPQISSLASYLPHLQEKFTNAQASLNGTLAPSDENYEPPPTESHLEKRDRETTERQERQVELVTEGVKTLYDPKGDANIRGDAFKTLFVARLPYEAEVRDLEREFGRFGAIERVRIVVDNGASEGKREGEGVDGVQKKKSKKNKSRGYAFVVFEKERDMKAAYKDTENLHIRGRRVLVDVERGRTVSGWKPRRFGGGLGGRGYTKTGPPKPPGGFGGGGFGGPPSGPGGFRGGGFRGGFGDRGGGFRGGRGGPGGFDRGGGGFDRGGRGGYGGGRGGIGYSNGPDGAPAGPRSGGGFGSGGGGRYDDRGSSGGGGPRNANYEPLPPRGGYGGSGSGQKRPYEGGGGYEDRGPRRRY